jgi:hypothetical protein
VFRRNCYIALASDRKIAAERVGMQSNYPASKLLAVLIFVLPLCVTSANADNAAGDRCAANLSSHAAAIYKATAPDIAKNSVISEVLRRRVRMMIIGGQIDRAAAEKAAPSAAVCLDLLRQ